MFVYPDSWSQLANLDSFYSLEFPVSDSQDNLLVLTESDYDEEAYEHQLEQVDGF